MGQMVLACGRSSVRRAPSLATELQRRQVEPRLARAGLQLAHQNDLARRLGHLEGELLRLPVGVAGQAVLSLAAADAKPRAGVLPRRRADVGRATGALEDVMP